MSIPERIVAIACQMLIKRGNAKTPAPDENLRLMGLTSLDMVNLMLAIEAEFGIEIPQSAMTPENFETIRNIEALVLATAQAALEKKGLMPLDRHARRFLEMVAAGGEARGRYEKAEERRRGLNNLAAAVDEPGSVPVGGVQDHLFAGRSGTMVLRVFSPLNEKQSSLAGIVFFHGGGWVAGSLDSHDGFCRRLANESGCRVIAVDYPLAPEHPFPQGLVDGFAAFAHIASHSGLFGIDPARLGIAGDSAGGTLAAAMCRMARDAGGPAIAFQLLICPILDIQHESAARRELADGYFLNRETLLRDLELYCPNWDRSDPRLSPLLADAFSGLPPAFIHTGQFDPFADEGEAYAARLSEAGVVVHGLCHPGMIHDFYCMPRMIPYAHQAMKIIGAEIRDAMISEPEGQAQKRIRPPVIRA